MNKLNEEQIFVVLKNKPHLFNNKERSLLWDLNKFLRGERQLSEKKYDLCVDTWMKVLEREREGNSAVDSKDVLEEIAELKEELQATNDRLDAALLLFDSKITEIIEGRK